MMAFLRFSRALVITRLSGLPLFTAALLAVSLTGCSAHKKPKPAAITLTPPPTLRQTPLYTSEMGDKAPTLPPLPGPGVPAAQPSPPANPEPRKPAATPVHHPKPSPAKPVAESDTIASMEEPPPPAGDAAPPPPTAAEKTKENEAVASPIGPLTTGSTPDAGETHHDAGDLIHSTQNGITNLKRALSAEENKIVLQIHSFLQQAQRALDNGDNEGAFTLATKAHVLLDELTPTSQ
jgi:outer membrane biosynthesis protein TonB